MEKRRFLSILRGILEQPTAPFHEDAVRAKICELLTGHPHLRVELDAFGNVIARYQRGKTPPRYAFAAHMDHPGWVGKEFLGGVPKEFLRTGKTQGFGEFAMWDLPPFELKEGIVYSRACDDLVGCAVIVATLLELEETGVETGCYGLFTRAEEVGFVGAIKLARSGILPKKNVTIVSLETSSERLPAKMGAGPIIRVGDRTSIFDSSATAVLVKTAEEGKLPFQRCLMSGGTCEATAYQLYGYRSAGMCVALGNYHNCGPDGKIASEFVSLDDVQNLARLCARVAADNTAPTSAGKDLRAHLEKNVSRYRRHF